MEDTTFPPESSISISEGTVPQLAFIRTNSMPSSESENTTQLPAETTPTKPNFQLTQWLDITAPVTTMSRKPSPDFSSDVSISSTAVGSAPASPSTQQSLQNMNKAEKVTSFLNKQEAMANALEASQGELEQENHGLKDELESTTKENKSLAERLEEKSTMCESLAAENEMITDQAMLKFQESTQEVQNEISQLKEDQDGRTKDQFKHRVELGRANASNADLKGRISEVETEIKSLKRKYEEDLSKNDKKLVAENILVSDLQQEDFNIRKQLKAANTLAADRQRQLSKARELQTETLQGWNTEKTRSTELEKLLLKATDLNDKQEKVKAEMGEKTTRLAKQLLEATALVCEYQKQFPESQESHSRAELATKIGKLKVQLLESKAINSKLEKQLVESETRNSRLEAAAKVHEADMEKKEKELASMTELVQTFSQGGQTTAEDFKRVQADYQRERKWRESAEKKEVRLEKSLKETVEQLKATKKRLASQEKKQEKARKDFEKKLAKLQCQIKEPKVDIELRGSGPNIGEKGKWILCCLVILVIAVMFGMLSDTWQKI
jgi:hypothetical protein